MSDAVRQGVAEAAFARLMGEYADWLRRAVRRFCPSDMGIQLEDVEQEVAIRLWRAIQSERRIEHVPAYIYKAAASATIDAMRKVRSRRETPLRLVGADDEAPATPGPPGSRPVTPSPEAQAVHSQVLEHVEASLSRLNDDRRRAVGLYLQGFSTREIAEMMSWTEAKARNTVHRALTAVRQELRLAGVDYRDE